MALSFYSIVPYAYFSLAFGTGVVCSMEPVEHSQKQPVDFQPSWHDRLLHWPGWEQMIEHWRSLLGIALVVLLVVWTIGWLLVRSETSSVAQTLRAESVVRRLQSPGSTPERVGAKEDFQQLRENAPAGSALASRFSGIFAEEEILQHVTPISPAPFEQAAQILDAAQLPIDASLTRATLLTKEGKLEEAVAVLDNVLRSNASDFSETHMYALLQKATILRDRQMDNGEVLDALQKFLQEHPGAGNSLDQWFSGKGIQSIEELRFVG